MSTSDFDLLVASHVAGDSAMFQLLGGDQKSTPKADSDAEVIDALVDALERMIAACTGQWPTKEVALAAIKRARARAKRQ